MVRVTRIVVLGAVLLGAGACAALWPRGKKDGDSGAGAASMTPATAPSATIPASAPAGAPLTVTVKDLRNRKGVLIFGVFEQSDGFPNVEKKSVHWEVKDADGDGTFTVHLPPGRYGASVLHDENRSGDMDRGFGGLPLEGYGVTNNPKPKLRAATFSEATFTLPPQGRQLTISLQYQFL